MRWTGEWIEEEKRREERKRKEREKEGEGLSELSQAQVDR
jgi:hypothetical protein